MTVWVNGRLLADDAPALTAFDHGVTVGDGVFETTKVVHGQPFALSRHLRRLAASADGIGLPVDLDLIRTAVDEVLTHAELLDFARLRITVTGGPGPPVTGREGDRTSVVVGLTAVPRWPDSAALVTVPWPRNERGATAGVKTISYAENVIALAYARAHGGDEAVFLNTVGGLCEGTGSNLFLCVGARLVTPPLRSGCLAGITRELLLEWLPGVEERELPGEVLGSADEMFISSSTRDVLPVRQVDGRRLTPVPGPLTANAAEVFAARAAADPDP